MMGLFLIGGMIAISSPAARTEEAVTLKEVARTLR
jgi:hypothetical protein